MSGPPSASAGQVSWVWPLAMAKRCRTFMPVTQAGAAPGTLSGKKLTTGSSTDRSPSPWAMPMAVEVKLLDSEYSRWRPVGPVRRPPPLGHHLAVAHQHQRVKVHPRRLGGVDKGEHPGGAHALADGVDRGKPRPGTRPRVMPGPLPINRAPDGRPGR